ncbi:MAG: hypothetical protein ACOYD9_06165, partial [Pyramidobacter sp.]
LSDAAYTPQWCAEPQSATFADGRFARRLSAVSRPPSSGSPRASAPGSSSGFDGGFSGGGGGGGGGRGW